MNKIICYDSKAVESIIIYQSVIRIWINQNNKSQLEKLYGFDKKELWTIYFKDQNFLKLNALYIQKSKLKQLPQINAPLLNLLQLDQTKIQNLKSFLSKFYPNLIKIKFRDNKIYSLPSINAPNLNYLNADNNQISQITQFALGYYPKLHTLNLGYNKLRSKLPWINSPQLQQLFLEDNKLSQTTDQFFQKGYYSKLKQLSIYNNLYEKIPIFIKQGAYQNIKKLDLDGNKINNIELLVIIDLNFLQNLFLSGNVISNLKVLHKTQFKNLLYISLGDNCFSQISYLEQCYFENKKLIIQLLITYCQLTTDLSRVFKLKNGEVTNFGDWQHEEIWNKMNQKRREKRVSDVDVLSQ